MKVYSNGEFVSKGQFLSSFFGLRFNRVFGISVLKTRCKDMILDMLFVFSKIDVVCLGEDMKVVKVIKGLRPFIDSALINPKFLRSKGSISCAYVLEFKSGEFKFKEGDIVKFEEK
ncbi:DUF192 domain-containing protein [Candidatus Woesearchaeota archaeon]|jgi:uncharacterized membrane protein (UPF0127 family)|nr:DUF192 domain-containing protein [Candidatus Woesearchaeota archaeon]MBT7238283.1 DUF192 domain-containing protein [Candidatus Woesearchaeota archaeon]